MDIMYMLIISLRFCTTYSTIYLIFIIQQHADKCRFCKKLRYTRTPDGVPNKRISWLCFQLRHVNLGLF